MRPRAFAGDLAYGLKPLSCFATDKVRRGSIFCEIRSKVCSKGLGYKYLSVWLLIKLGTFLTNNELSSIASPGRLYLSASAAIYAKFAAEYRSRNRLKRR